MALPDSTHDQHQDWADISQSLPVHVRPVSPDEVLDRIDLDTIGELVFTVRVYDRDIRGYREEPQLTQDGAMTIARILGSISTGQPVWSLGDDEVNCDVSATDHVTGVTVWGTSSATLTITYTDKAGNEQTRRSEHARAIALGKAQRNAICHLIPVSVQQALFRERQAQSTGQDKSRSQPAPKPAPARQRLSRDEYVAALGQCGDSTTLAATWRDVRRDGLDADSELMSIAFRICRDCIGNTYTAQQWNQVTADIRAVGFLDDPEIAAALKARREELLQATGEETA